MRKSQILSSLIVGLLAAAMLSFVPVDSLFARPWFRTLFDMYSISAGNTMLPTDANRDGRTDFIGGSGALAIGLANGDFIQGTGFTPPTGASLLALCDYNHDGWEDALVTGKIGTGANAPAFVFLYRKLAGNGFASPLSYPIQQRPNQLATGDFNGDGQVDVLVLYARAGTPSETDSATVYWGVPAGLGSRFDFQLPEGYPNDVLVADFDEDGVSDAIVVCTFPSEAYTLIYYMSRAGGITGTPVTNSEQSPLAWTLGLADVDHDGHMDFVVANANGVLSTYFGHGDGSFHKTPEPIDGVGPYCAGDISLVDIDRDGELDILSGCYPLDTVNLVFGNGLGMFSNPFTHHFGRRPYGLALGDFDGDGYNDIAGTMNFTGGIGVLRGNAEGTYNVVPEFPGPANVSEAMALDWDEDGREDLVTVDRTANLLNVLINRGDHFDPPFTFSIGFYPGGVRFMDVDLDGHSDLLVTDDATKSLHVFLRDMNGGYPSSTAYPVGDGPSDVATGDFDEDGLRDLVVSNFSYPSWSATWLKGIGNGQFQPVATMPVLSNAASIDVGDFNEDGHLDFVTGHTYEKLSLVFGHGDGTFDPYVVIGSGSQPATPVMARDLNLDGHLDLVTKRGNNVSIRYGTGLGTFGLPAIKSMGSSTNIALRDLDLDGRLDIVSGGAGVDYVTVRFGSKIDSLAHYGVEREVQWVVPIAFDDGPSIDVAAFCSTGPTIVMLIHPDAPSAAPEPEPPPSPAPFVLLANPARSAARFRVTRDLDPGATLEIFDAQGRRVAGIAVPSGHGGSDLVWSGRRDNGRSVAPGRYFASLKGDTRWSVSFLWFP